MVFAKIFPEGSDAEQALHLVCEGQPSDYHRQFIQAEFKDRKAPSDSESGSDRSKDQETKRWCGYYELSLQPLPTHVSTGWRLGRGSSRTKEKDRAVDIILISPGNKARGVAAVHAIIQFHPRSGALMIVGVLDEKPVQYEVTDSASPLILGKGEKHVLYLPRNRIKIGDLYYNLIFEDFNYHNRYARYRKDRDDLFQALGYSIPHTALSAIPRPQDAKKGPVVLHGTMSEGGFGWVFAAVNARDGEPLAVKEHKVKNKRSRHDILSEIYFGGLFQHETGILQTIFSWCEHQRSGICRGIPESVFAASPLGIYDFRGHGWSKCSIRQIIDLHQGPLEGLAALHKAGIIHRDVHRGNLLIISLEPPRAVIHDFGKAVQAESARDKYLGPIVTRAPEINGVVDYTDAIDIWSFAFAYCYAILPSTQKDLVNQVQPIDKQWHTSISAHLSSYGQRGELECVLVDLLEKMLQWNPEHRITAADALRHLSIRQMKLPTESNYCQEPSQWETSLVSSESAASGSPQGEHWLEFHQKQQTRAGGQTNPLMKRQRLHN